MSTSTPHRTDPTTVVEYHPSDALPEMTVDAVDRMDLLGATVMVGHYPDGTRQIKISPATASTPIVASLDTTLLQHPPTGADQ